MTSDAYVFVEGLEQEPVICGRFWYDAQYRIGRFVYGQSWLARGDAFALDPIHLPLTDQVQTTRLHKGIFGVLHDAGADSWGRQLIGQLRKTKPQNELEYLIAGASMGVGALTFSLSRSKVKPKVSRNSLDNLELLIAGKNSILKSERVSVEVKKAFQYGDSMGGARPKTVLQHQGQLYLIKFNRADDLMNIARVEHAAMSMLAELDGLDVAETEVIRGTEDILMIKRFDRQGIDVSHHFLSANSLLTEGAVSSESLATWYSYASLAEFLRKQSANPNDATQLFKRMVFNACIGNTDDHSRNHAVLYDLQAKSWRLSPAYDVLPINNHRQHALGLGEQGRLATVENLMSQCKRFGLQSYKAKRIIDDIVDVTKQWPDYFAKKGVAEGDLELLRGVIPQLD